MKHFLYSLIQWTWGLPQTLAGAAVRFVYRDRSAFIFRGALVTVWERNDGLSLGRYVFVPEGSSGSGDKGIFADRNTGIRTDMFLLVHEFGHTIQSLILGLLYLPAVGLPSLIWSRAGCFRKKRKKCGISYYAAIFERTASELGAAVCRLPKINVRRTPDCVIMTRNENKEDIS